MRIVASILVVLFATNSFAEPLPKKLAMKDPMGQGYMGVYPIDESSLEVDRIEPASPAEKAGLRPGDKFVEVGEFKPKTFNELREYIMDNRPGTRLRVIVLRKGKLVETRMVLGTRKESSTAKRIIEEEFPIPRNDP